MVDTILLKMHLRESGYKIRYIAQKMGISYQALLNKVNNLSDFKATEITVLCDILNFDAVQREKIFFAHCVRENHNTTG